MLHYVEILKGNPNGVLASQDGERVSTRVFQFLFAEGNKVYFCTSSEKPVYTQLQANPHVSFCTYPQNYTPVLSVNGKAVFVEDIALKTKVLAENPLIKDIYKTPDNPIFKVFYIDIAAVDTFSFAEGPKQYQIT